MINFAWAQAGLNNAVLFLEKGLIDKAKASIDEAASSEKATSKSKFWFYKGEIYTRIAMDKNLPYYKLDPNPIPKAYEAYKKVMDLEPQQKGFYKDAEKALQYLYTVAINHGSNAYQEGESKFKIALSDMRIAHSINPKDTIPLIYGAAIAYEDKDFNSFVELTEKILDIPGVSDETQMSNYTNLAYIYSEELKNKEKALSIISRGVDAFPKNLDILKLGGELHQRNGQIEKAIEIYKKGAKAFPDNYFFHINLGAIYYNKASEASQAMSKIADELKKDANKKKKMQEEVNGFLRSALPHLEEADKLRPDDIDIIEYLFIAYDELGMKDKAEATDKRINKIRKGQ